MKCPDCGTTKIGRICPNCYEELYIFTYQNEYLPDEISLEFADKVRRQSIEINERGE